MIVLGVVEVGAIVLGGVVLVALAREHRRTRPAHRGVVALVVVLGLGVPLAACGTAGSGSDAPAPPPPASTTTGAAPARAAPGPAAAPAPDPATAPVWDALAQCEAGGDWAVDSGNGRSGGLQLRPQTWVENGGGAFAPVPSAATREQQIVVAERVRATQGFALWGSCATRLGLR